MGLDLIIKQELNETTDNKGRRVVTVVELGNLDGCWGIKELLDKRQFLENCATNLYQENTFFHILDELKEIKDSCGGLRYQYDIARLEDFIEENELKYEHVVDEYGGLDESVGRTFQVYAWW